MIGLSWVLLFGRHDCISENQEEFSERQEGINRGTYRETVWIMNCHVKEIEYCQLLIFCLGMVTGNVLKVGVGCCTGNCLTATELPFLI